MAPGERHVTGADGPSMPATNTGDMLEPRPDREPAPDDFGEFRDLSGFLTAVAPAFSYFVWHQHWMHNSKRVFDLYSLLTKSDDMEFHVHHHPF